MTIIVSLATKPREPDELRGLVYSVTPRPRDEGLAWFARPWVLAVIVLCLTIALNLVFF